MDTTKTPNVRALRKKESKQTKSGKPYLVLTFQGLQPFKVWNNYPAFRRAEMAEEGLYYEITGTFGNSQYGYEVEQDFDLERVESPPANPLIEGAKADIRGMVRDLRDPLLKEFADLFLDETLDVMSNCGAARSVHHSYRGGLVVHTSRVMRNAKALSWTYGANVDLLVVGALVHDVGKVFENLYEAEREVMPFTLAGELLSHIPLGLAYVREKLEKTVREFGFDDEDSERTSATAFHLLHLVASHHGSLEWGSPVVPKTVEAMILHAADLADAKIEQIYEAMEGNAQIGEDLGSQIYDRRHGNVVTGLSSYGGQYGRAFEIHNKSDK